MWAVDLRADAALEVLYGLSDYRYQLVNLLPQDSPGGLATGCGNGSQSEGITNTGALQPGQYRLTLDARADANVQLLYGLDTGTSSIVTVAAVKTSWQTFTIDFSVPAGNVSSVAMAVWEATLNNPAWEVANLRSFRLDTSNNPTGRKPGICRRSRREECVHGSVITANRPTYRELLEVAKSGLHG